MSESKCFESLPPGALSRHDEEVVISRIRLQPGTSSRIGIAVPRPHQHDP